MKTKKSSKSPESIEDMKKSMMETNLQVGAAFLADRPRQCYEETGNPIFLFQAYRVFRNLKQAPPEWIMEYFDRVGVGLLAEADKRLRGNPAEDTPDRIAFEIFEMRFKNRDVFKECAIHLSKYMKAREIASRLAKEKPELIKPGKRATLINLITMELNKNLTKEEVDDKKEVNYETVDKWFSRPITDDIEKWDQLIIKL